MLLLLPSSSIWGALSKLLFIFLDVEGKGDFGKAVSGSSPDVRDPRLLMSRLLALTGSVFSPLLVRSALVLFDLRDLKNGMIDNVRLVDVATSVKPSLECQEEKKDLPHIK